MSCGARTLKGRRPGAERIEFLNAFVRDNLLVEIMERIAAFHDPKDNKFLELTVTQLTLWPAMKTY